MAADGTVRLEAVERQAALLAANGVIGAFVCGSTGEGTSLTSDERRRLAERWVDSAPAGLRVIVHVGHDSLVESRALLAHARQIGAAAAAAIPPHYFRPEGAQEVADWLVRLASVAEDLPLYYYHIPVRSGVSVCVRDVLAAAGPRAPNVVGVKFTHEDLMDFLRCLRLEGGRFDMLFGRDEILLGALAMGARGAVGTTYNFAAPLYRRIMDAFARGDLQAARAEQARAAEMIAVMLRSGGVSASKAMMGLIGLDCGPPRPPLRALDAAATARLRAELERVGFFEFCCRMP